LHVAKDIHKAFTCKIEENLSNKYQQITNILSPSEMLRLDLVHI